MQIYKIITASGREDIERNRRTVLLEDLRGDMEICYSFLSEVLESVQACQKELGPEFQLAICVVQVSDGLYVQLSRRGKIIFPTFTSQPGDQHIRLAHLTEYACLAINRASTITWLVPQREMLLLAAPDGQTEIVTASP